MTKRSENKTGQAVDPSQKTGLGSDPTSYISILAVNLCFGDKLNECLYILQDIFLATPSCTSSNPPHSVPTYSTPRTVPVWRE
jgi:hypothetical protein